MFCPRCGTVAAPDATSCSRCGASLARPEVEARTEPPAVRAPTNRGEDAQRAAGIVAHSLPKAPPRPRLLPPPPPFYGSPDQSRPAYGPPSYGTPAPHPAPPPVAGPGPVYQPPPAYQPAPGAAQPPTAPGPAGPHGQGGDSGPYGAPSNAGAGPSAATWPPPPAPWRETAPGRWAPPAPADQGPADRPPEGYRPPEAYQPPSGYQPPHRFPPQGEPRPGYAPPPPQWPTGHGGPPPGAHGGPPPGSQPDPTTAYPYWGRPDGARPSWAPRPRTGWSSPDWPWFERLLGRPSGAPGPLAGLPPTYFWQSLVSLLLFLPTGVAAVVYSLLVTRRAGVGDGAGAVRASLLARFWCVVSVIVFAVVLLVSAATGYPA